MAISNHNCFLVSVAPSFPLTGLGTKEKRELFSTGLMMVIVFSGLTKYIYILCCTISVINNLMILCSKMLFMGTHTPLYKNVLITAMDDKLFIQCSNCFCISKTITSSLARQCSINYYPFQAKTTPYLFTSDLYSGRDSLTLVHICTVSYWGIRVD